ncbi:Pam3-gp28 family putative phage holin [Methylobacterium mesophilicum]
MTPQTVAAIRIVIVAIGSILVGRGLVTQETIDTIGDPVLLTAVLGGIAAAVSAGIGVYSKRKRGILKDAGKVLDGKGAIVTDPKTASEVPGANVVGSLAEASRVPGVNAH